MSEVRCSWVPGTLDTLNVVVDDHTLHLKVYQLHRLFGVQALNAIYLQGHYTTQVARDMIDRILAA